MREETKARAKFEREKEQASKDIERANKKIQENEKPVYIYQCVRCMKKFKTTNTTLRHCGILTQWLAGIEGIGINGEVKKKEEKKIKVHVSGYIEMKETDFKVIMAYSDPASGFIRSMSMPFCNSEGLGFSYEE